MVHFVENVAPLGPHFGPLEPFVRVWWCRIGLPVVNSWRYPKGDLSIPLVFSNRLRTYQHPQAEVVIHELRERIAQGFCTLGQARALMRRGLHPNTNRAAADAFFELMDELEWPRRIPWSKISGELRRELTYTGKRTLRLATG